MYLDELTFEERQSFLELATHAMDVNGEIKQQEQEIYKGYAHECRLPEYEAKRKDIVKLLKSLKKSTPRSQKIIVLELIGILLADSEICDEEETFLHKIGAEFDFSKNQIKRFIRWYQDFTDIIGDGYKLIGA